MRHSGERSLCPITISWEWVKQGADRQGSVGILTRAKKDRHEQPGREEWASKPRCVFGGWQVATGCTLHGWDIHLLGWCLSLKASRIYRHPWRTTPRFIYFDLIIGLAALVLSLWSCKFQRTEKHNPQMYSFQRTRKLKGHVPAHSRYMQLQMLA